MSYDPLPNDGDKASNGHPWGETIRGWLSKLRTDVQSVLPDAAPYVQGQGITKTIGITQADYTALTTKDPYALYIVKQGDGSIIPQWQGGAVDPTPPSGTPTAPTGSLGTITQTSITITGLGAPSSTGGSAITGYQLFAFNPTGTSAATFNPEWKSQVYLPTALPTSFTFTNMVAGTAYQVGAYALNANGEGTRLRLSATTTALSPGGGGGVGGGGGLPDKVAAAWYFHWQRPRLRELPTDVQNILNHYILGLAQSGGSGTGTLSFGPANGETAAELKTDVLAARARGANVVMGFGGSSDGGITITNSTQVTQAYNSITGFVTTYGINGIDIDLEPSGSAWNQASLVSLCQQLKTNYGSSFIVGITVGLYSPYTTSWINLANALGSNYDYIAPMCYDFPEAADSRLSGVVIQKCDTLVGGGIPANKILVGYMCKPPEGYANASPPQVTLDSWNAAVAKYPSLRGGFIWETYIEGRTNYQWSRLTGKKIRGL